MTALRAWRHHRARVALAIGALLLVAAATTPVLRAVIRPTWDDDKVLIVLVMGSDDGPPRSGNPLNARSDAIHLVAVDTRKRVATIVDIPRDAYIGGAKVNAHLAFGGPEGMRQALENYTDLDIDRYALTTFRGLREMVDGLGGLVVDVEQRIDDPFARADLQPGQQRLTGKEALAYSRARKTITGGDFGRTRHQGEMMRAAHAQVSSTRPDLATLTKILALFARNTVTDISPAELPRLANLALAIDPDDIRQESLMGGFGFDSMGQSIVNLNTRGVFDEIRRGDIGP